MAANDLRVTVLAFALLVAISLHPARAAGERELELVMTRNPDLANGEVLYRTCSACHGPNGEGVSDGTVPALAGQPFSVLARQIVNFRAGTRSDERMVHFTDRRHLAFSQPIADVAGYISKLRRPAGKIVSSPPPPRPRSPSPLPPSPPQNAERGAMVYVRTCERCHGPVAEGDENMVMPRLASQHYEYLVKQLKDAAEGRRPDLAAAHEGMSRKLTPDEMQAVAAWLASLPAD